MRTILRILLLLIITPSIAQIGIGTTNPAQGTSLHVDDNSGAAGVKIPDADLVDLNTVDPLPAGTNAGTMVYNINPFSGEGIFFWDGQVWAPIHIFNKRAAKFRHNDGATEQVLAVNLNKPSSSGGVDVELMDDEVFNTTPTLIAPVADVNGRFNSVRVAADGRYRITVFVGLEQLDGAAPDVSTSIQGRLKITEANGAIRYDGSYHRSTEMEKNGTGDDDGSLYFTEVIFLHENEKVAVNCTGLEEDAPVYQRDPKLSAFIIEKLR